MKKVYISAFMAICVLLFTASLWAQYLDLNCNKFWLQVGETGSNWPSGDSDDLMYPNGFQFSSDLRDSHLFFLASNWTDLSGNLNAQTIEYELFHVSNKKVVKYPYPTVFIDGIDATAVTDYDEVDPNLVSDQMVENIINVSLGVTVVERAYAFSHPDYEDFVIVHYQIINSGKTDENDTVDLPGQVLHDFYFVDGKGYQPHQTSSEEINQYSPASYVDFYGEAPGDSLKLIYDWDGDDPLTGDWEDEGNPHKNTGEFLSPQYLGHGIIHADKSVSDRSHDPDQPHATVRKGIFEARPADDFTKYSWFATPGFAPAVDPDLPGANPRDVQHPIMYMSIGPYELAFGDTINIVIFRGGGSRSHEECVEMGAKWKAGEITDDQKNEFLRWGKLDLLNHLSKAKRLWENGMKIPGGFNPPPPATFTLKSGPGLNELEWSPVDGAVGYNLYRARPGGEVETWFSPLEVGITTTSYIDETVQKGFDYYYNLTAVDASGIESNRYVLRTFRKTVVPFAAQGKTLDAVRVVPNPFVYDRSGQTNYVGQKDKLIFAGLPGPCNIKIFTQTGDLVDEIEHLGEEGTQEWLQITQYNQFVASGVYIYYVESLEGKGSKMGKFIVIR